MAVRSTKRLRVRSHLVAATLALSFPSAVYASATDLRIPLAARFDRVDLIRALIHQKADVNATLDDGSSALHWAIANDDLALVGLLLQSGASPKATTRVGDVTPLALAARNGNAHIVAALLKAGADPNVATSNGATPLMFAAESGSAETVTVLLDQGAKIDTKESIYGQNALMFAAAKNRAGVIRILIKRGADPKVASTVSSLSRQRFDDDGNPIGGPAAGGAGATGGAAGPTGAGGAGVSTGDVAAGAGRRGGRRRRGGVAAAGDPASGAAPATGDSAPAAAGTVAVPATSSAVTPALATTPPVATPAAAPASGQPVTTPAAASAITTVAQSGVLTPANPAEAQSDTAALPGGGKTRAGTAGINGGGGRGANAGGQGGGGGGFGRGPARTFGGNTPLTLAAREGHIEAIRALVESGANVNEGNASDNTTPIVTAICNGHYDAARYLLDHGADPNLKSTDGLAALYAVIDTQWAPVGWSPNPITDQENNSYLDLMKALLDKGADPNAQLLRKLWFRPTHHDESWINAAGASVFWRAAQATDLKAMHLLIAHKADPKIATNDGVNSLMAAAGLGWNGNFSTQGPDSPLACVQYCLDLGVDPTAQNTQGYTAIGGAAYRGENDLIKLLLAHGAKLDTKTSRGWSITDMANGPSLRSSVPVPHPQTVALLLALGAPPLTSTADEEILGVIRRRRPAAADSDTEPAAAVAAAPNGASTVSVKSTPPASPAPGSGK